jgi:hypothetical protein
MKKMIALAVCSFGIAATALAGTGVDNIKYEQLQAHCADQAATKGKGTPGTQLKWVNPTVSCNETITTWEYGSPGELSFPAARVVESGLADKFFAIGQDQAFAPVDGKTFSCPVYEEVQLVYNTQLPISCDQVLAYASLHDFCVASLDSKGGKGGEKEGKAGAEKIRTGKRVTLCTADGGKGDGGKKQ